MSMYMNISYSLPSCNPKNIPISVHLIFIEYYLSIISDKVAASYVHQFNIYSVRSYSLLSLNSIEVVIDIHLLSVDKIINGL